MRLHRSQWPRDLKRAPAAARYLGLQVRNPLWAWMSLVIVVCFGEGLITRPECGISEWMWPPSFDCEEAVAQSGLFAVGKNFGMAIHSTTNCYQYRFPFGTDVSANYFSYCTSAPLIIFLQTKFVFLLEVNLPSFYGMLIIQSKSESHQQQLKLINITRQN